MKNSALYFIIICVSIWVIACTWPGAPDIIGEIEQEEVQEDTINICKLHHITQPAQRKLLMEFTADISDRIFINWRGDTVDWVSGGVVVSDHIESTLAILSNHITYDSVAVIDNTTIIAGVVNVDFVIFLFGVQGLPIGTNTNDVLQFANGQTYSRAIWAKNPGSVYMHDLVNQDTYEETKAALPSLRAFNIFSLKGWVVDSVQVDESVTILLGECNCCKTIILGGHPLSQAIRDQAAYQSVLIVN